MKIGIASYTQEQWELLKQRATDRDKLDRMYRDWEKNRDQAMGALRGQGYEAVLIPMDVAEIEAWCNGRGRKNTSEARAELCSTKLREMDGQQRPA